MGEVCCKPPFSGPQAVLAYLSRYTHRVAISNHRLVAFDNNGVTFRYKDYRRDGADRQRTMTLSPDEFIRRFLLHVLPRASTASVITACSRASTGRQANVARARELLAAPAPTELEDTTPLPDPRPPCPCCGGRMVIIEIFQRAARARATIVASLYRDDCVVIRHDPTSTCCRSHEASAGGPSCRLRQSLLPRSR